MKYKILLLAMALIVIAAGAYFYVNRKTQSLTDSKADYKISAIKFLQEYSSDQVLADKKYLGKVIQVDGNLKDIEKDDKGFLTFVLGDLTSMSSVRCSIDTTVVIDESAYPVGTAVSLKGECTGFNADDLGLGADIVLNRSIIINNKK
ncbi:MAG: OB-fold putative lipoprotein [Pedobacter sp.]|nr:OB-fold putative lipoprotein [Pedobacter sp.]